MNTVDQRALLSQADQRIRMQIGDQFVEIMFMQDQLAAQASQLEEVTAEKDRLAARVAELEADLAKLKARKKTSQ